MESAASQVWWGLLGLACLIVAPHLVGWLAMRLVRRSTWVLWPAAAIATFTAVWYLTAWRPAHEPFQSGQVCEANPLVLAQLALVFGLLIHTSLGAVFGMAFDEHRGALRPQPKR
jgi:hypothetical protein